MTELEKQLIKSIELYEDVQNKRDELIKKINKLPVSNLPSPDDLSKTNIPDYKVTAYQKMLIGLMEIYKARNEHDILLENYTILLTDMLVKTEPLTSDPKWYFDYYKYFDQDNPKNWGKKRKGTDEDSFSE